MSQRQKTSVVRTPRIGRNRQSSFVRVGRWGRGGGADPQVVISCRGGTIRIAEFFFWL